MPSATPTDRQRAQTALEKIRRGDVPTKMERRSLDRVKAAQREEMTDEILRELPKRTYCKMSGRQVRTVNEQAARYKLPCDGTTVDLNKVIRWLHDMLATHGGKLLMDGEDDPIFAGPSSPMLENCRREKWLLLQMERQQKEHDLLDRHVVREAHQVIGSLLRTCVESMERTYGEEPAELLRETINDCQQQINELLKKGKKRNGNQEKNRSSSRVNGGSKAG